MDLGTSSWRKSCQWRYLKIYTNKTLKININFKIITRPQNN
jgi:hypothetical protein